MAVDGSGQEQVREGVVTGCCGSQGPSGQEWEWKDLLEDIKKRKRLISKKWSK